MDVAEWGKRVWCGNGLQVADPRQIAGPRLGIACVAIRDRSA
ncbi:MAG: hypothetical protein WAU10_27070 [Caldilineaceae bacterium]